MNGTTSPVLALWLVGVLTALVPGVALCSDSVGADAVGSVASLAVILGVLVALRARTPEPRRAAARRSRRGAPVGAVA